jgi:hypothetical protein
LVKRLETGFNLPMLKTTAVQFRIDAEIIKQKRLPFTVIVDEFADLAQEDFIGFLDRARSSKMGIRRKQYPRLQVQEPL